MIALYLLGVVFLLGLPFTFRRLAPICRANRLTVTLLILFGLFIGLLALTSSELQIAVRTFGKSVAWLTCLLTVALLATEPKAGRYVVGVFLGAATLSAALSLVLDVSLDYAPLVEDRLFAIGHNANPVAVGITYAWTLVFTAGLFAQQRSIAPWLLAVPTVVLMAGLVRTQTISAWIGLIAGLSMFALMRLPSAWLRISIVGGLGAFTLAILTVLTGIVDAGNLLSFLPRGASFRPEIWAAAIDVTTQTNPLTGLGPTATSELNLAYKFEHPHSVYVSTYFYTGLVGLIALIGIVVLSLKAALQLPLPAQQICLPLLVMGLVTLAFDGNRPIGNMSFVWIVFWFPVALIMGLATVQQAGQPDRSTTPDEPDTNS